MGVHWNGEITLGNLLTIFALVLVGIGFFYNTNWRLKILESWKGEHQLVADLGFKGINTLIETVAELKQIAKGQDRRLSMLEDLRIYKKDTN